MESPWPHHSARYTDPHTASRFAFLAEALRIYRNEPPASWWDSPVEITPETPQELARWAEAKSGFLEAAQAVLRRRVIDELRAAGMPDALLEEPHDQRVEAYISAQVKRLQAVCRAEEAAHNGERFRWPRPEAIVVYVVTKTYEAERSFRSATALYEAVAVFLNDGIPTKDRDRAMEARHIRRAFEAFSDRELPRMFERLAANGFGIDTSAGIVHTVLFLPVHALIRIEREARGHASFRYFAGAALARRIEEHPGVAVCLTRTLNRAA